MELRQLVLLAFQVSILCTVFGFGLKATPDDFRYLFQRPGLLLRSLVAVLIVMPIVAILMARVFEFNPAAQIALVALSISPVPPLLPQRETKGGGQHMYGLALMAVFAVVGIATVPLSAKAMETVLGRPFTTSPGEIAKILVVAALAPLASGMIVRAWLPAAADRLEPVVTLVAKILLPLAALALLAGTWHAIGDAIGGGAIIAMVVFVAIGLLVGDLFGGPEREHSIVLALSSACRHPAIALSLASAASPNQHFGGTILLYLLVNIIVGVVYVKWRQASGAIVAA